MAVKDRQTDKQKDRQTGERVGRQAGRYTRILLLCGYEYYLLRYFEGPKYFCFSGQLCLLQAPGIHREISRYLIAHVHAT
jgi:hypothetical protein